MIYDFVVIGGGIVGLSAAVHLLQRFPGQSVLVLEKEPTLAWHQTGHNSGVIHAGVYYRPGSLQARFCREGSRATEVFCAEHGIPAKRCGKLLVATNAQDLSRLQGLADRCADNQIVAEVLDAAALSRCEPHVRGLGALRVRDTGMVNYVSVAQAMAGIVKARGGEIQLSHKVVGIEETPDRVSVQTGTTSFLARKLLVCGGLQADRLADYCGLADDFRIVPFRGEYFRLGARHADLVSHHIYPIPDPALPFLGVHLTRMIDGGLTVGPNAVLCLQREGYSKTSFDLGDMAELARFPGFWKLLAKFMRPGLRELWSSLSKARYAALCRRYCPEIHSTDLLPHRSGVRAQVVMHDGQLFHDFLIRRTARTIHVCNAPSPAATSAIPIGRHLSDLVDA